jgi:hypothetical protein
MNVRLVSIQYHTIDVVRSLREGISSYLNPNSGHHQQRSVTVYENAVITAMVCDRKQGIVMRVAFDSRIKNWAYSKKLVSLYSLIHLCRVLGHLIPSLTMLTRFMVHWYV